MFEKHREQQQLLNEKKQLIKKLQTMKNKIHKNNVQNNIESASVHSSKTQKFEELLEITSNMRKMQEEEQLLFERNDQQRKEHEMNQLFIQQLNEQKMHLKNMNISNLSAFEIIEEFQQKCKETQIILGKLDVQYTENHELLNEALSVINSEPVSMQELQAIENHVHLLSEECELMERKRDSMHELISISESNSIYA